MKAAEDVREGGWEKISYLWKTNSLKLKKEIAAAIRVTAGHYCLAMHLAQLKINSCQECIICCELDSVMDANHHLTFVELRI